MKVFVLICVVLAAAAILSACATTPDVERDVSPLLISAPARSHCRIIPAATIDVADPWAGSRMECRR